MPRIDPSQLLQTLGVLLAPNGGIKSAGEVSVEIFYLAQNIFINRNIYSGSSHFTINAEVL